jgi:hypothetical protein
MAIDWYEKAAVFFGEKEEPGPVWTGGGNHYANFIDAVRSRKTADLNCPIEEGAISCTLMHLGNIAYRVGRTLYFDRKTMSVVGDKEANAMFTKVYRKPFLVPENV